MTDIAYAQVWADHVVSVGEPGETVTVTVLSGGTVYYGDPTVTAASNLGALTQGQSAALTNPATWLRSASQAYVQITGQVALAATVSSVPGPPANPGASVGQASIDSNGIAWTWGGSAWEPLQLAMTVALGG